MKTYSLVLIMMFYVSLSNGQDTYKFKMDIPLFDYKENLDLPYRYPSMNQALNWSADMYELGFWGIDELGNAIFRPSDKPYTSGRKFGNNIFRYLLGLGFSKYGSELPIPLGVWAHEEFHRSVLGVQGYSLKNGNWAFDRWDGTVYGITDESLSTLKQNNTESLLYSYTAGVHYEVLLNEKVTIGDFYYKKSFPRSALLLYNAWYVFDYFRFSAGSSSDSAKVLAPPHESIDPYERDFTGSDLNAWVYDMFNPSMPFTMRDPFPNGNGVNRRIGYSDMTAAEQDFLREQKKLSLLNFLNPYILFINRIRISDNFSFNFFTQYLPTHFGNDIALFIPLKINQTGLVLNVHRYGSYKSYGVGAGLGWIDLKSSPKVSTDFKINVWDQPETFLGNDKLFGASAGVTLRYSFTDNFSAYVSVDGKTKGWLGGNPYLDENASVRFGLNYSLKK